jgi:hypothetical protein
MPKIEDPVSVAERAMGCAWTQSDTDHWARGSECPKCDRSAVGALAFLRALAYDWARVPGPGLAALTDDELSALGVR